MKKLTALFLALALCLSLCTVTAFAVTIPNLAATYTVLDYKNPENLGLNSNNEKVTTGFELHLLNDLDTVYGYSSEYGWISVEEGYIEKNKVDFTEVNKAQWMLVFNTVNAGDTFISDGFTVTVNDTIFNEGNNQLLATGQEEGYYIDNSRETINIFILQDISVASTTVTISPAEHGTVTASPTDVASGTDVTLTVTPDSGYQLKADSLKVTASGTDIPVKGSGNSYSFVMPNENVTVTAQFEYAGGGHHHGGGSTTPTVTAPKTADMGVAIYGVLSVSSLLGMGWVSKKKR